MPKVERRGPVYIGIDPGMAGSIVALSDDGVVAAYPMPYTEADIWEAISGLEERSREVYAIIEKVHSMPGQGVSSCFKFGHGYGGLRMALLAAGIAFEAKTPQAWMKGLGLSSRKKSWTNTQWKNYLKATAQERFPNIRVTLKTADGLLIAQYCRLREQGKVPR